MKSKGDAKILLILGWVFSCTKYI